LAFFISFFAHIHIVPKSLILKESFKTGNITFKTMKNKKNDKNQILSAETMKKYQNYIKIRTKTGKGIKKKVL